MIEEVTINMSNYNDDKQSLENKVNKIFEFAMLYFHNSPIIDELKDLRTDLKNDKQIITVVGEFKRGKTSIVNALLKENLLPANVTPTTATINVICHNNERTLKIVKNNQESEYVEFNDDTLSDLTYDGSSNLKDIHHVEITLPLINFDKDTIIIDTPGIGDLNEHRLDVTYSYIPRSDLVIFVFDMTTPIRKTELNYLKNSILKLAVGEIIFIANFSDRVGEEEIEETLEYMNKRLTQILQQSFTILPLSALYAIDDDEDPEYAILLNILETKLKNGRGSNTKITQYNQRLSNLSGKIKNEIEQIESIRQLNIEELEERIAEVGFFKEKKTGYLEKMSEYIEYNKQEIIKMKDKSLDYFFTNLEEQLLEKIDMFDGPKFKQFVEKQLSISVKHQIQGWVNSYTPNIDQLIHKVEKEVSLALQELFKQSNIQIAVTTNLFTSSNKFHSFDHLNIEGKSSDSRILSGVIAGGAGTILLLTGVGIVFPLIAMAGAPFLNEILEKKRLESAKAKIRPELESSLMQISEDLKLNVSKYIEDELGYLERKAKLLIEELIFEYEQKVREEAKSRYENSIIGLPNINREDWISLINS